jgi:hypothetical protein
MPSHELDNTSWLQNHGYVAPRPVVARPASIWNEVQQREAEWTAAYRRYVGNATPENQAARIAAHEAYQTAQQQAMATAQLSHA